MTTARKAGGAAAAIALAVAAALPFAVPMIQKWESGGKTHLVPYKDPVGIWTVCDGETRVEMRTYTKAECEAMLVKAVTDEFGPQVLACTPTIADRPRALGAAIVMSYNIGTGAYCRSTVARRFNEGNFVAGCRAFSMWNKAGGKVWKGLTLRRADERALCLEGAR